MVDPREDPVAYIVDDALHYGARRIRLDSVPPLPTEIRIRFEQSDQRDHWAREVHGQGFPVEVDGARVAVVTIPRGFALPKW